jgi:O-antigen/teichoic acid export membrane protein
LAFPAAFGVALVAKPFINIIYGSSYLQAAIPLYLISFLIIENTFSNMFYWLFAAKEHPKTITKVLVMATIMNIVLNAILILSLIKISPMAALLGAASATLISRYFNLIVISRKAKTKLNIGIKASSITKPLIASIIMFFALIIFQNLTKLIWPMSIFEILFAAFVYVLVILLIKGIRKEDFELIKRVL